MSDLAFQIIQELGGAVAAVVIVLGALWVFGKDAILKQFQDKLDRGRSVFEYRLERAAVVSDTQAKALFESSLEVWTGLSDLELHVKRLWRVASKVNVSAAAEALERAREVSSRHEALIVDSELGPLRRAIHRMEEFIQGKQLLIALREHGAGSEEVDRQIQRNGELRLGLLKATSKAKAGLKKRTLPQLPNEAAPGRA